MSSFFVTAVILAASAQHLCCLNLFAFLSSYAEVIESSGRIASATVAFLLESLCNTGARPDAYSIKNLNVADSECIDGVRVSERSRMEIWRTIDLGRHVIPTVMLRKTASVGA